LNDKKRARPARYYHKYEQECFEREIGRVADFDQSLGERVVESVFDERLYFARCLFLLSLHVVAVLVESLCFLLLLTIGNFGLIHFCCFDFEMKKVLKNVFFVFFVFISLRLIRH